MDVASAWPLGEEHVTIDGRFLSAVVVPTRGAKVISLRDSRGIEWLAQPDRPVGPPARPGADFLEAEMAGWDECAPTIVACELNGIGLADHGELWTARFDRWGNTVSVVDSTLGYRFERSIHVTDQGLAFSYKVTTFERPVPFLWAAHPQFRAPVGTHVRLPSTVTTVIDVMEADLPELDWTPALGSIDSVAPAGYRKIYAHPDSEVRSAELVHPDGAILTMSWSSACSFFGVWFDKFAYRKEPIIALEPTTSYFDSLHTALALGRAPIIPAHDSLSWIVELSVRS